MREQMRRIEDEEIEVETKKSIQEVVKSIQYFMGISEEYTAAPPSQTILMAFQGVQQGFEALSSELVFQFIHNLQEEIGVELADGFMNKKFGSDILAFYFDPNAQTRECMNANFNVLLKALDALSN